MSLTPAQDAKTLEERRQKVELCGKNLGPHDYIPIEWNLTDGAKRVSRLFCRICFSHVSMKHLLENYSEVKL